MVSIKSLVIALGAIIPALAHMELKYPAPLKSKYSPYATWENIDYSMTTPLNAQAGFPCKNYINSPNTNMGSVATLPAGSTVNYTIAGSAVHGGGSCQIVLSYDQGKTWQVIASHIGGCLVDNAGSKGNSLGGGWSEDIVIPKEAPSGVALFGWTWFNQLGNREMYMNCAVVTISGGGAGLTPSSDFPAPFVANSGNGQNECTTLEGTDIVFPNPGKNVVYGGKYAGNQGSAKANTGVIGNNCLAKGITLDVGGDGGVSPSGGAGTSPSGVSTSTGGSSPSGGYGDGNQGSSSSSSTSTTSTTSSAATSTSTSSAAYLPASTSTTKPKTCKKKKKRSITAAAAAAAPGMEKREERMEDGEAFVFERATEEARNGQRAHQRYVRRPLHRNGGMERRSRS